ncbi:uncharacterized protein LOC110732062 isoform X1 [Chenopodium quinoa]|uniref:uncharacterized protein LOC110732062 isoform X1 n=2 Tax=Chenopodium quinoa TaxID=63459 RepID=UPI000B795DA4|nr:uncharacterized protein LOC110732062 isoform X1 [Chenopodium quinoa]
MMGQPINQILDPPLIATLLALCPTRLSFSQSLDMGIEREQSSTSEAEREEKRIVMLALSNEGLPSERLQGGTQLYHTRAEFHSVDLKHNILTRSCFPSIIMVKFLSSAMVSSLNKFIYLVGVGGARSPDVQSSDESSSSNHTFYSGGSYLDMSDEAPVWCPAPVFVEDNTSPNYVSFLGNIYNFGSVCLAPQVLDCGALGHCKSIRSLPIPQSLAGCSVSVPVLPDPSNKRILMRLYGGPLSSPSLYAFTPDPDADAIGTWECLTSDFQLWAHAAAVVNGVIYFHCHRVPSLLCAFHITKKIWLKVWWDSCFKDNVDMNVETFNFDAMLHLGHNILCFAGWMPIYSRLTVFTLEVIFYKFQVLVTGETVTVKVCDSYSYELPRSTNVFHFLPV